MPHAPLQAIADNVWYAQHHFTNNGLPSGSGMTVVRLPDGGLWLHSPIPATPARRAELAALGPVRHLVGPNRFHHLFLGEWAAHHPQAQLWGAPGLRDRRPDLPTLRNLAPETPPDAPWAGTLHQHLIEGLPLLQEIVWFHVPSGTLLMTDLCQCWTGDKPWRLRAWLGLMGGADQLTVQRPIRWFTRDRAALQRSVDALLDMPIERLLLCHRGVVTGDVKAQLRAAFTAWL